MWSLKPCRSFRHLHATTRWIADILNIHGTFNPPYLDRLDFLLAGIQCTSRLHVSDKAKKTRNFLRQPKWP